MTRVRVEVPRVLELIEAAVKERGGEWVYPDTGQCRYLYDPENFLPEDEEYGLSADERAMVAYFGEDEVKPACLVGLVLHTLDPGFDGPMMEQNENSIEGWMSGDGDYEVIVGSVIYEFPHESVVVMQAAQSAQDVGKTWDEAEKRAIYAAERLGFH